MAEPVCPPEVAVVINAKVKKRHPIGQALSCATCALLGASYGDNLLAEPWDIDIGLLSYVEKERNTGFEFLLNAKKTRDDGDEFRLGIEIDTLSGATPNGATPSNVPQTFTQSSGNGSYTVAANELPADDTHMDTRLAVEAAYLNQFNNDLGVSFDGRLSMEFDYISFALGSSYSLDFNQQNSTAFFSVGGAYDMVHPVGNVPDALSLMTPAFGPQNRNRGSITRSSLDIGLGLTQVLDQRSLMQFRLTRSTQDGYLTDPYKMFSIIDDSEPDSGATIAYRFENRPEQRDSNIAYLAYKRQFEKGLLDLSYRFITDSWEIESSTLELRYRIPLSGSAWLQPKLRYYRQSSAAFFRHSLPASEALPDTISSDTRLAAFDAWTLGLVFGSGPQRGNRYRVIAEYYWQQGEDHPVDAVGLQADQDLFPDLEAFILKFVYSFRW